MRPLTLTVEGLRSFRAAETIDFTGRDYLAIIGDTGAGKSSLLEAMGWVLYGNTSWTGHPNQELMHDTSAATRAVLTFSVRGQTWRATRTLRRRDDRSVGAAQAELVRLDERPDGTVREVDGVDKVRNVNEKIEELIGLNYEAFKRTVVLPQGQFAQLLVSDQPRERAAILEQVWGVEGLGEIKDAADETLREVVPTASRVEQALADAPDDPTAHLAGLRSEAGRLSVVAQSAAGAAVRAGEAVAAVDTASRVVSDAEEAQRLLEVDESLTSTARSLAAVETEMNEAAESLAADVTAARAELAAVPPDDDGMSVADVATIRAALARLPELASAVDAAGEALVAARETAARLEGVSQDAEGKAEAAQVAQDAHEENRAGLGSAVEAAQTTVNDAVQHLATWRAAIAEQSTASTTADRLRDELPEREHAAADARSEADAATRRAQEALAAKQAADREHAAVAAAAGLAVGDDCTVCHRPLPDGWAAPGDSAHEAVNERAANAASTERRAAAELARADAALASARERLVEAETVAQARDGAVARAHDEVTARLGAADPKQDDEVLLAGLRDAVATARSALELHEAEAKALTETRQQARSAAATAAADHRAAMAAESQASAALDRARQACETAAGAIPSAFAVAVATGGDGEPTGVTGLDSAAARLDERDVVLSSRAETRSRLQSRLTELDARRVAVEQRRRLELTEPLDKLVRTLETERQKLDRLRGSLGDVDVDVPSVVGVTGGSASQVVAQLHTATTRLAEVATARLAESTEALTAARTVLEEATKTLGVGSLADHAIVSALERQRKDAEVKAGIAKHEADLFEGRVEPIRQLREASAGLAAQALVLEDLSAALNPGAFPKWLTMRRSHDLLLHASVLLEEMSGGRYNFAEVTGPDDPWKVIDNDSGLPRTPASLSGGETFVASLSLALGMVEMMARSGGHLESLWLDEGFGALDRSNLDSAVEALSQVAARGRMVAVISHVRAVAEQVNHVLAVTRGSRGSHARWLEPDERAALAEMDAGGDPGTMAAVAGLLD